jgi:uncharacterized protein with GYD domain
MPPHLALKITFKFSQYRSSCFFLDSFAVSVPLFMRICFPNLVYLFNSFLKLFFSLDTRFPAAHIQKVPLAHPPSRSEPTMSYFSLQISFTNQAWSHLVHNPEDRFAVVRAPIQRLGGSIQASFFTTGRFDLLAIAEFPEHITPADIAVAFADGGAVASTNATPLLSFAQALEARSRNVAASSCTVRPQRRMVAVAGS